MGYKDVFTKLKIDYRTTQFRKEIERFEEKQWEKAAWDSLVSKAAKEGRISIDALAPEMDISIGIQGTSGAKDIFIYGTLIDPKRGQAILYPDPDDKSPFDFAETVFFTGSQSPDGKSYPGEIIQGRGLTIIRRRSFAPLTLTPIKQVFYKNTALFSTGHAPAK